ncbi:bifunctional 4-hydroxy-2-oxoglutarate aldolase/2-dehydro-3-deoxy-phosphogluconate aldolase [Alkalibaculum sp. M08DMB]|uniref:Bifunctional 4-hydroxy-2-oxoglutarate aldolase/2-dehydro-3-deoxy-phosphogluconate aldolase n=1 Tax=Alkalibaculum sporogenes TaxID=2655001 RepID=A0A6A7K7M7_9FIRM|nr:bifunctional 4-hydroxy-2-oxoglutarate aldolase/2-dehydro-3-deoxy-phosphogluconate aldolase [Alkalibaculum sporogenes]MPW25414.1 bifunctional 4-hydroxy-2-oxoglutarate aldolase/2-dehydro-3-deoxy-phosphogluconate aldolase [Alkalibaculum sporogenes]
MKSTIDMIVENKLVAISRGISSDKMINTVQALKDGGIVCIEVTFSAKSEEISRDTLKAISMIKEYFGDDIAVGAGTVLTVDNVRQAADAGAQYMISPNINEEVIKETKRLGLVSIPGAFTPTEVINAYNMGADIVKLFPAAVLGVEYIKAITGPITHIPLTAVGGIHAGNANDFIRAGCIGVSVGGNLVNKKLIDAGDFEAIKKLAQEYKL